MASLKDIKLQIQSYKKTGTVTKAMQAVSAVKMRKTQERALAGRSYAAAALAILERIASTVDFAREPLMAESTGRQCVIVITSDKGLAGALNSGVIRACEQKMSERGLNTENTILIAIGRRGADYFANRGYDIRMKFENMGDEISESEVLEITRAILSWHGAGEIGSALVCYTNFISTFEQEPLARTLIPITPSLMREMVSGIRPVRGKYSPLETHADDVYPKSYRIEPSVETIVAVLLPKLLNIALYHALLESKASEHSARMVAMKSATDKAKDMAASLTRTFNKVRQAAITREVSEITSGIEAMR